MFCYNYIYICVISSVDTILTARISKVHMYMYVDDSRNQRKHFSDPKQEPSVYLLELGLNQFLLVNDYMYIKALG